MGHKEWLKGCSTQYTHLFIHQSWDPLDAAPPCQPPDGGLGDALDVIPQHLPVSLGASFAQALPPLPSPMSVSTHNLAITHNFYLIAILNLAVTTKIEFHFWTFWQFSVCYVGTQELCCGKWLKSEKSLRHPMRVSWVDNQPITEQQSPLEWTHGHKTVDILFSF